MGYKKPGMTLDELVVLLDALLEKLGEIRRRAEKASLYYKEKGEPVKDEEVDNSIREISHILERLFPKLGSAGFDEEKYEEIKESIKTDYQRLVLVAFLVKGIQKKEVPKIGDVLELGSSSIKTTANRIAKANNLDEIGDIGGAMTGFTQGKKAEMGLVRKGREVKDGHIWYIPICFVPYIKRVASDLKWELPPP